LAFSSLAFPCATVKQEGEGASEIGGKTLIDHTGVNVSDLEESRRFYAAALAPLGYELLHEFHGTVASFGEQGKPDFWIARGEPNTPRVHVAFRADTRHKVE
jgi:catechol 2,3-dioxygenase-like lactoylglutathione lyase family enzyme